MRAGRLSLCAPRSSSPSDWAMNRQSFPQACWQRSFNKSWPDPLVHDSMCAHLPTIPQQSARGNVGLSAAIDAILPQPSAARKYVPENCVSSCDEILMTGKVEHQPTTAAVVPTCMCYGMAALNAPTKPRS